VITIYTIGYQGVPADALEAKVKELNAVVIDTRFKAWSKDPEFNQGRLLTRFGGERYRFMGAQFGNTNYRSQTGPITIADFDAGYVALRELIVRQPVLLLCACWQWTTCHRTVVAGMLKERLQQFNVESEIKHLTKSDLPKQEKKEKKVENLSLF
jgi:uncharacterized protein (DUF488 family)